MPLYDYRPVDAAAACEHCRNGFEVRQSMNDPALEKCPRCGSAVRRAISAPNINFRPSDRPHHMAAVYRQMDFADPIPRDEHFIELMLKIVQPEIDRMMLGEFTPEEAGRRAAAAANAFLATFDTSTP